MAYSRDRIQGYGNFDPQREPELALSGAQHISERAVHYAGEIGIAVISGVERGVTVLREQGITEVATKAYGDVLSWIGNNVRGVKPDYPQQQPSRSSQFNGSTSNSSFDKRTSSSRPTTINRWSSSGYNSAVVSSPSTQNSAPVTSPIQPAPSKTAPIVRDADYERSVVENMCIPVGARLQPPDAVIEEFATKIEHFDSDAISNVFADLLTKCVSIQQKIRIVYVMEGIRKIGLTAPVSRAIQLSRNVLLDLSKTPQGSGKVGEILQSWGLDIGERAEEDSLIASEPSIVEDLLIL